MNKFRVVIPMYVNVSKKTKAALNLNKYRNMHHQSSNNQKKEFKRLMSPQIKALPKMKKVHIHYIIYPKVKREFDIGNVASIVDKFFSDALVELGILDDDNYKFIPSTSQEFGEFTQEEPHVIAIISDLKTKLESEKPMRILLDQTDFNEAVQDYVAKLGISPNTSVTINVVDGEIQAEVIINPVAKDSVVTSAIEVVKTADLPSPSCPDDVTNSEEAQRLELLEEAKSLKIKGIRSDMKIETLRDKLQEHNDADSSGGDDDVDANSGSSDNSNSSGSALFETGGTESSTETKTPDNSANPSKDSPEESSKADESPEAGDDTPAKETVAETPPAKKSSIFDVD